MENKKIIWIVVSAVIILAIAFYFLNFFGLFENANINQLVIIPIKPICLNESCESNPYPCPTDVTQCKAIGQLICSSQTGQRRIAFRTNAESKEDYNTRTNMDRWFSIRGLVSSNTFITTDDLHVYCVTSEAGGSKTNPIYLPEGKAYIYNTQLYTWSGGIYVSTGTGQEVLRRYELCDSTIDPTIGAIARQNSPVPGMSNKEVVGGDIYNYNCQGLFAIYYPGYPTSKVLYWQDNNFKYQSSDTPGNYTSAPKIFPPGYTAVVETGTAQQARLFYGTELEQEDCASGGRGKCLAPDSNGNSVGFKNCDNGIINPNNITYCQTDNGFYCNNGACVVPFQTKEIQIVDSNGNIKNGFTSTEQIKVNVKLQARAGTPLYGKYGTVKLYFYRVGEPDSKTNSIKENFDFNNPGTVTINIDNPGANGDLGLYYLVVKVNYDTSKPDIVLGLDNPNQPDYQISIGSSVSCTIQLQTSITDVMTSKLLTNIPILVKLNTYVGGIGNQVLNKNVKVYMNKGTSQETSIILLIPSSEGESGGAYTYIYNYQTNLPGDVYAVANISDSGVPAMCSITSRVEDMTITTSQYNVGGTCLPPGPHTFYFETLDTLNRQAEVNSTLCVKKPGSGTFCEPISELVQLVPGGKKGQNQFTYNLVKNVGETAQYYFLLSTYSDEFKRRSDVPDIGIEVKDNCVPTECRTTKECQVSKGDNYVCVNGKCQHKDPPWLIYIAIAFGVLILLVALFFIIKSVRNKSPAQDFYTGFEGL